MILRIWQKTLSEFLCCPKSCALLNAFAVALCSNDEKGSLQLWVGGVFPRTPWPLAASAMSVCLCWMAAVLLTPSPWGSPTAPYSMGKRASVATAGTAEGLWGFHGRARRGFELWIQVLKLTTADHPGLYDRRARNLFLPWWQALLQLCLWLQSHCVLNKQRMNSKLPGQNTWVLGRGKELCFVSTDVIFFLCLWLGKPDKRTNISRMLWKTWNESSFTLFLDELVLMRQYSIFIFLLLCLDKCFQSRTLVWRFCPECEFKSCPIQTFHCNSVTDQNFCQVSE